jgi:hypothetical protein
VFLCLIHADTIARDALLEFVGVQAFIACYRCWFEGAKYLGGRKGTYFKGYSKLVAQNVLGGGKQILAREAKPRTHQEHVDHGRKVESGEETAEDSGNKGLCCVARFLPYFDVVKGFPNPVAHSMLLGLVKGFWKELLQPYKNEEERPKNVLPNSVRREMQQRKVRCPHDRGRPYRDVVKHLGSYTMEDLLHFTETDSLYIVHGCLPAVLARAWKHLRGAVIHYFRDIDDPLDPKKMTDASNHLQKYAEIVEEVSF